MINFIICDDNSNQRTKIENIVHSYMMKNKLEYQIHLFEDYNSNFLKIIQKPMPFKIYILDIETPSRSGIDVARMIRAKDTNSALIFITGHNELSENILKHNFLFLSFINKFDNSESRLKDAIKEAIKIFDLKPMLRFKEGKTNYSVASKDILYITRDSVERKSIIVTDYSSFKLNKSISEIKEMLDDDFIQTHRACIVNSRRVLSYNKSKKIITFDNGETIDIVSTRFVRNKDAYE